eukprot:9468944-Pyramimonas_sp.AAC.2
MMGSHLGELLPYITCCVCSNGVCQLSGKIICACIISTFSFSLSSSPSLLRFVFLSSCSAIETEDVGGGRKGGEVGQGEEGGEGRRRKTKEGGAQGVAIQYAIKRHCRKALQGWQFLEARTAAHVVVFQRCRQPRLGHKA